MPFLEPGVPPFFQFPNSDASANRIHNSSDNGLAGPTTLLYPQHDHDEGRHLENTLGDRNAMEVGISEIEKVSFRLGNHRRPRMAPKSKGCGSKCVSLPTNYDIMRDRIVSFLPQPRQSLLLKHSRRFLLLSSLSSLASSSLASTTLSVVVICTRRTFITIRAPSLQYKRRHYNTSAVIAEVD
jgi:hypothetical protein